MPLRRLFPLPYRKNPILPRPGDNFETDTITKKINDMKTYTLQTILLVEDDLDDQDFFTEALKLVDKTVKVVTARDGEEALQRLHENTPDLILLDLNMPRMNGAEFLRELKKLEQFSQVPVVIYSSFVVNCDREEALELGVKQFVRKPIAVKETVETIRRILASVRSGFELPINAEAEKSLTV
jgi:CheY-like chemotaxis protein